ncbi:V-type ATP synthase subunit A [Rubritalea tangerina]|uniref:V-type ATP synthase alpha chain n=1 Tax=Rubritalea tangerina TaxID=430798 RepID=A0ABW4Z7U0_9BACT
MRKARVIAAKESLVTVETNGDPIVKNEVGYIQLEREKLKAEVLRVRGNTADMQVFEDTRGVKIGDEVELTGEMLSAELGPGLLGSVFDGLQNPLQRLADEHGFFLPRGVYPDPLDRDRRWEFKPEVSVGDRVVAGAVLGHVDEGIIRHRVMVPFREVEAMEVVEVMEGSYRVDEVVVRLRRGDGSLLELDMIRRWPVRQALPQKMFQKRYSERLYPSEPLTTTIRIIDTFFPMARGGTGCIPGPFGAGKTVLQSLVARYSTVDVVIIVACGERAGEVVETIHEFPNTKDPRTGGSLMDRTIIVCNTSSMPVAARESSIYTGVTLGEYYRQMGLDVLLIADSTSRWAQAMRETSGRMEEIPGEEAFPAYLDSSIKNLYERAGVLRNSVGEIGSLTMIGTVSPAGGNFEEPVTQATLGTVKDFLGLSYDRAYKRFYPAIDPLISWSRYLEQLAPWYSEHLSHEWVSEVQAFTELLHQGDSIYQMMQVTGEEGITMDDFVMWQKATLLDMVYLQQDAFDKVDVSVSRERQVKSFQFLRELINSAYDFSTKQEVREYFTKLTGLYKNWNYSAEGTDAYQKYFREMQDLARENYLVQRDPHMGEDALLGEQAIGESGSE